MAPTGQNPIPNQDTEWAIDGMKKSQASSCLCIPGFMGKTILASRYQPSRTYGSSSSLLSLYGACGRYIPLPSQLATRPMGQG